MSPTCVCLAGSKILLLYSPWTFHPPKSVYSFLVLITSWRDKNLIWRLHTILRSCKWDSTREKRHKSLTFKICFMYYVFSLIFIPNDTGRPSTLIPRKGLPKLWRISWTFYKLLYCFSLSTTHTWKSGKISKYIYVIFLLSSVYCSFWVFCCCPTMCAILLVYSMSLLTVFGGQLSGWSETWLGCL